MVTPVANILVTVTLNCLHGTSNSGPYRRNMVTVGGAVPL